MSEIVEQKRQRLQALFDQFNEGGSTMTLAYEDEDLEPVDLGLMDSFMVTRVDGDAFWVMNKVFGYQDGWQHTHTIKVVEWSQDDTYLLDLVDDMDRRFHIELIFPELEPALAEMWDHWQAYKARNRERFRLLDENLLADHMEIALNWEGVDNEEEEEEWEEDEVQQASQGNPHLRYMVDYVMKDPPGGDSSWIPIGVWVQGPGPGLDFTIRFVPGHDEAQQDADSIRDRLIEYGMRGLRHDFLDFYQQTAPYFRMRGAIIETDEFPSLEACANFVLNQITSGRIT
ncbi:MAG: hypothetical protein OXL39_02920 [Caldilineaceae bacterium]|nr:hypothetical protein [Caldilineaceae bacterium]